MMKKKNPKTKTDNNKVRVWSNQKTHVLLVGIENGAAI